MWKGKITASPENGLGSVFDQQTGQYAQYMGFYGGEYYGEGYVGTPLQAPSGNYWTFDTQSPLTVVPVKGQTKIGWYACEDSETCTDEGETFTYQDDYYKA